MTTCPPRMACATTPPTAITPNQRSHGRDSFIRNRIASTRTRIPKIKAITLWVCSKPAPPARYLKGGNQVPNDFGQSGTESAASCEVTRAPAKKRRTVQQTTNLANLCTPGLYVVVIAQVPAADYTPEVKFATKRNFGEASAARHGSLAAPLLVHRPLPTSRLVKGLEKSGSGPAPLLEPEAWQALLH